MLWALYYQYNLFSYSQTKTPARIAEFYIFYSDATAWGKYDWLGGTADFDMCCSCSRVGRKCWECTFPLGIVRNRPDTETRTWFYANSRVMVDLWTGRRWRTVTYTKSLHISAHYFDFLKFLKAALPWPRCLPAVIRLTAALPTTNSADFSLRGHTCTGGVWTAPLNPRLSSNFIIIILQVSVGEKKRGKVTEGYKDITFCFVLSSITVEHFVLLQHWLKPSEIIIMKKKNHKHI